MAHDVDNSGSTRKSSTTDGYSSWSASRNKTSPSKYLNIGGTKKTGSGGGSSSSGSSDDGADIEAIRKANADSEFELEKLGTKMSSMEEIEFGYVLADENPNKGKGCQRCAYNER